MKQQQEIFSSFDEKLRALENDLRAMLEQLFDHPYEAMSEMIAHHLGWAEVPALKTGKRLRPLVTLLACQAAGGDWRHALPAASCVELIHNFSLVHDDIEDGSELRRGRETLWHRWGAPQAINTGDALFVLAHLSILRLDKKAIPPQVIIRSLEILDQASLRLTMGQHLDIAFESQETVSKAHYLEMIEGKTASLLAAAAEIGAAIAGAPPEIALSYHTFGLHMGMAFQIVDDILGIWGSAEVLGKQTGEDLLSRKKTLPVILGLDLSPAFTELWRSGDINEETILRMANILEEAEVLSNARLIAKQHTALAVQALRAARPSTAASEDLERLAQQLLHREH